MASMKPVGSKRFRLMLWGGLIFTTLFMILGCGGGDNNKDSGSAPPTVVEPVKVSGVQKFGGLRSIDAFGWAPDSSRIAYIAAQDSNSEELYSSPPDGATDNVKVSGGGTVDSFIWSPDLTVTNLIAYLADQQTINVNELYTSTPEGQDNMNVSGTLEAGGRVTVFYDWARSTTDPNPLVFMAAKDSATKVELYASFDNGATVVKLSGDIIPDNGNVVDFAVSPDGRRVAYKADQQLFGVFELYVVPVSINGGTAINVSRQSTNTLEVRDFAWSFDSSTIAFRAFNPVPNTIGNVELFTVLPSGGDPVRVSIFPNPDGEVSSFDWAPSDLLLAYTQNTIQGSPDRIDLYSTRPFRQDNNRLSNTTGTGSIISTVRSFKWSPNSLLIAFNVVLRGSGLSELLVADPSVLFPAPVPLSGTLQSLGEVVGFEWSPDSIRVAYRADQSVDNRFDLLTVSANGSRPPDLISRLANDSSEVRDFAWAPDSSRIAYIADQDTVGVFELYTDNTFGTSNRRVSAELSAGENVSAFLWAPDAELIAYQANQDDINIDELYTTVP
jgi:Tol biopolymer transport system component